MRLSVRFAAARPQSGRIRRRSSAIGVLALVAASLFVTLPVAQAEGSPTLSVAFGAGPYSIGSPVTMQVTLNTAGFNSDVVQANFAYPQAKLQLNSVDTSGSSYTTQIQNQGGSGVIEVAMASLAGELNGNLAVFTAHFTAIANGSAHVCPLDTSGMASAGVSPGPLTTVGSGITIGTADAVSTNCVSQNDISPGAVHTVTITGHGFAGKPTVKSSGTGVTFTAAKLVNTTTITATIHVAEGTAESFRNITVKTSKGTSTCFNCLQTGDGPQIYSVSNTPVARGGKDTNITITGYFIGPDSTVKIAGMKVLTTQWNDYQDITVVVNVSAKAKLGPAKITISDPYDASYGFYGVGTCATCLTVQ